MDGSQPPARGELHPTRTLHREALRPCASLRHPLILDGFFRLHASGAWSRQARLRTDDIRRSKCLHVLSSFQRTGNCCFGFSPEAERPLRDFLLQGNLPILLEDSDRCQSLTANFSSRRLHPTGRIRADAHAALIRALMPPETAGGCRSLKDFLCGKKICSLV
jgi:hypothetical protein